MADIEKDEAVVSARMAHIEKDEVAVAARMAHIEKDEGLASVRFARLEKGLLVAGGETAALGDRVSASTRRLEAIEDQLVALSSRADATVETLQQCLRREPQTPQQHGDLRFEAKAEELQSQLGALDAQGRDICATLRDQAQRRCQFEDATTKRLEALESVSSLVESDFSQFRKEIDNDFSQLRKEIKRLRETFDVETM
jgi:chromosome segregation ATPase